MWSYDIIFNIIYCSSFWGHMEECAVLMDLLHKKLSQDDFELENVKIEVRILFSQHSSYSVREWVSLRTTIMN